MKEYISFIEAISMKRLCLKNRDFVVYGIHIVSPNLNISDISFIIDNGKKW